MEFSYLFLYPKKLNYSSSNAYILASLIAVIGVVIVIGVIG